MIGIMGFPLPPVSSTMISPPPVILASTFSFSQSRFALSDQLFSPKLHRKRFHHSISSIREEEEEEGSDAAVQGIQIPETWLLPSNAYHESEWLRIALHKWLDDEYCPEPTNFEISKLAAQSYYESLISKETDLGEILLKIVVQLETISFQQSFHGPFSSANAAVDLITQRIDSTVEQ